jgi:hypothetical protein
MGEDDAYSTLDAARLAYPAWTWLGPAEPAPYFTAERRRGAVREILGGWSVLELARKVAAVERAEESPPGQDSHP